MACTRERTASSGAVASSTWAEGLGGAVGLGDLGVGQLLDRLHPQRGLFRLGDGAVQEQRAAIIDCLIDPAPRPGAEQAVAAAKMVIQEAERCADREGVQPERDLGQFDRHGVLVHARRRSA